MTPAGGCNGSVAFSLGRLPKGVAASFRDGSGVDTTELVFAAGKVAQTGKASVTLIGTSGSLTETTTFNLAVSAADRHGWSGDSR